MEFLDSISALRASLVELSKSDTIHYEVTAKELSDTRFAILQLEGFDAEKSLDLARRFRQISELETQIDQLFKRKSELELQVEQKKTRLEIIAEKIRQAEAETVEAEAV